MASTVQTQACGTPRGLPSTAACAHTHAHTCTHVCVRPSPILRPDTCANSACIVQPWWERASDAPQGPRVEALRGHCSVSVNTGINLVAIDVWGRQVGGIWAGALPCRGWMDSHPIPPTGSVPCPSPACCPIAQPLKNLLNLHPSPGLHKICSKESHCCPLPGSSSSQRPFRMPGADMPGSMGLYFQSAHHKALWEGCSTALQ